MQQSKIEVYQRNSETRNFEVQDPGRHVLRRHISARTNNLHLSYQSQTINLLQLTFYYNILYSTIHYMMMNCLCLALSNRILVDHDLSVVYLQCPSELVGLRIPQPHSSPLCPLAIVDPF
jgi:hypothetical protein